MRSSILKSISIAFIALFLSCNSQNEKLDIGDENIMIRIAEIEINTDYFEDYIAILREEAHTSVLKESGVLCIYPMYERDDQSKIRLLEIYASEEAYQSHLKTPHFLHYKSATKHMITSLELIDMEAIDKESMAIIFEKIQ